MTTPHRPFRFGYLASNQFDPALRPPTSGAAWARHARRLESLGYSTFLLPDHFDDVVAPLPALTAAAAATTTLRVGTMVLAVDYRNPLVLERDVTTIERLTDGRFELGLGAGWKQADYDAAGLAFEPAGRRIDRLERTLVALRRTYAGPLLAGGGGGRVLGVAARHADIVGLNVTIPGGAFGRQALATAGAAAARQRVELVREAAGERFPHLELNMTPFARLTDEPEPVLEAAAARYGLRPADVLDSPLFLIGPAGWMIDALQRRRDELGVSYVVFTGADPAELAPVVDGLAGR